MKHSMGMKVFESRQDLYGIALNFYLSETLSSLYHLVKSLVSAYFKKNVDVLSILKEMLESYYIAVPKRPMDPDFTHELDSQRSLLTFYFALDLIRVDLGIIFAAVTFLVSRLVSSKTYAKPPYDT
jgi:hypothetical protein